MLKVILLLTLAGTSFADDGRQIGFATLDITPEKPLRLSGYGSRSEPFEGVDTPLEVRAMAVREADGRLAVLAAIDTIGFPAALSDEVAGAVRERHGVPRSRLALCFSHSHTAPVIARGLTNLFAQPMSPQERADIDAYTDRVRDRTVEAIDAAVADLSPGRIFFAKGEATFARHRRVMRDGVAVFGEDLDGPVDHELPVLKVTAPDGKTVRGLLFNYACHCTTLGTRNRINADWLGYAVGQIEAALPGVTAMCCVGCAGDANPPRTDGPEAIPMAKAAGDEIAEEVARLLELDAAGGPDEDPKRQWVEVPSLSATSYGFAGLPSIPPAVDELKKALDHSRPQVRRHARIMLDVLDRKGRLPETYPMPIQVWRFGEAFSMVFLGGEVVSEYALRIRGELPGDVWVSAYANDVFGYVASERMRAEGGYEVDFSMVYYLQPGRWDVGTEDLILKRVHDLFNGAASEGPLSLNDSLDGFSLPPGYRIEAIAAEPLIRDPINFAFDARGRLWVVEMGDYPEGPRDAAAGRVKVLTDTDGDGRYDDATVFLDGLPFPTGVHPWRDGVVIAASPDLIFARDTDGDGRADERTVLWTGFDTDNPQHLLNGFAYGLDHRLYMAGGTRQPTVRDPRTGTTLDLAARDASIDADAGDLRAESGQSQYGRSRDDYGHWFGSTNSEPLFHFAMRDADAARNPYVSLPSPRVMLTDPPTAPPVFPTSRTEDRFNDLFAAGRITSACGVCLDRDERLFGGHTQTAFVCEPVHNLIMRVGLERDGTTFAGRRLPDDSGRDFITSSDNWCRPVWARTGPGGGLVFADMYRAVIEHPEWIPDSWQERLDLYAGHRHGRIYRVVPEGAGPLKVPDLAALSTVDLVAALRDRNGWTRDTAQRLLIERSDDAAAGPLRDVARQTDDPRAQLHALWTLHAMDRLEADDLRAGMRSDHPSVVANAVRLGGLGVPKTDRFDPGTLVKHPEREVRTAVALATADLEDRRLAERLLVWLYHSDLSDRWLRAAIVSAAAKTPLNLMSDPPGDAEAPTGRDWDTRGFTGQLIATNFGDDPVGSMLDMLNGEPMTAETFESGLLPFLSMAADGLVARGTTFREAIESRPGGGLATFRENLRLAQSLTGRWVYESDRSELRRINALRFFVLSGYAGDEDLDTTAALLSPSEPPEFQKAVVDAWSDGGYTAPLVAALPEATPELSRRIQASLLTRWEGVGRLLDALEAGDVLPRQLDASTRDTLLRSLSKSRRDRAERIFRDVRSDRAAVVAELRPALALSGDAAAGRKVFEQKCAACHKLGGLGNALGPDLAGLSNKSPEFLLTAVLDPNRAVEAKYRSFTVSTASGRTHAGMIVEESATGLTLARPDGQRVTVLRSEIEEAAPGLSFMPEGLEKDLSPRQLADVLEFVCSSQTGP